MSGVVGLLTRGSGALWEHRTTAPHIPSDELAQDRRPVAWAGDASELLPQVVLDPDGSVRRVGLLHEPHRSPCISTVRALGVAVYIHDHYARGYTRRMQVALWGGRSRLPHKTVSRCMKLGEKMASARTLPDHAICVTHKNYALTCEQYESLLEASGGGCQLCGFPASQMPQKKLYIDHNRSVGDWAVRGLLCIRCNTIIGIDREVPRTDEIAAYLASPWYARMLAERGLTADLPPEPPIGTVVEFAHYTSPRRTRTREGWVVPGKWHLGAKSWWQLHYSWGPHRIRVIAAKPHRRRR